VPLALGELVCPRRLIERLWWHLNFTVRSHASQDTGVGGYGGFGHRWRSVCHGASVPRAFLTHHVRLCSIARPPWTASVVFGDKFVGWSRSRYVATWTLEAGLEFPLRPQSRSAEIHRCLWIQWAGYAILCRWSYATPLQPEQVSAHDS